jgi:hypothetical protein
MIEAGVDEICSTLASSHIVSLISNSRFAHALATEPMAIYILSRRVLVDGSSAMDAVVSKGSIAARAQATGAGSHPFFGMLCSPYEQ